MVKKEKKLNKEGANQIYEAIKDRGVEVGS